MDQKKAYSLEGYLDKKSPSILKGYQKRHFAVRSEGQFIVYSKKKLVGGDVKPKGDYFCKMKVLFQLNQLQLFQESRDLKESLSCKRKIGNSFSELHLVAKEICGLQLLHFCRNYSFRNSITLICNWLPRIPSL